MIEFSFLCGNNDDDINATVEVSFDYIFGSDEYPEYVDSPFNDVFAFYLNGENIAVLPNDDDDDVDDGSSSSSSSNITAVSINTVNALRNSRYFHENTFIVEDGRSPYPNIEADGFTTILTARGIPRRGVGQWNHIKLAITDVGDNLYDSYVLIAAHSFTCTKRTDENSPSRSPTATTSSSSSTKSPTVKRTDISPSRGPIITTTARSPTTNRIVNNVANSKYTSFVPTAKVSAVSTINKCSNINNNIVCPNKRIDPILGYHDCGWGIFHDCTCQVSSIDDSYCTLFIHDISAPI